MSNNQSIAVITSSYNPAKSVAKAIESVVDDEYVTSAIVVDDCSNDEIQLFKLHAFCINAKNQWVKFYTSVKKLELTSSLKALFNSLTALTYILCQLKSEFIKRLLIRVI
ncbi:glycosyltransferase [Pseudoalteromonas sp. 31A1]|uniref:glycosyltransferase n=1 Tax=Pseudoalteromonas sp. 31A1 TaxID=2686351 RepID=UPI0013FE137F|nr:glycosyltransferase [Pseudoalteromonas sp. 31A1]